MAYTCSGPMAAARLASHRSVGASWFPADDLRGIYTFSGSVSNPLGAHPRFVQYLRRDRIGVMLPTPLGRTPRTHCGARPLATREPLTFAGVPDAITLLPTPTF
jgi:hypothetical protein